MSPLRREAGNARQRLLRTAAEVFATQGFDRAMGKEICKRAGMNNAAINYYFGGMQGLCLAVMAEAQSHLITLEQVREIVASRRKPKDQLKALFQLFLTAAANPPSESWVIRVVIQQIVASSPMLEPMVTENFLPRAAILRKIVSEIMHLPADHPRVALACVHVLAPCFLMVFNKHLVNRAFPSLDLSSQSTSEIVEGMCRYALAGMKAVASGAASQPEQVNR